MARKVSAENFTFLHWPARAQFTIITHQIVLFKYQKKLI